MLIALRTPLRNRRALNDIEYFENLISKVLENNLLDKTDPDIISLLDKVRSMQIHIDQLKSQLVF